MRPRSLCDAKLPPSQSPEAAPLSCTLENLIGSIADEQISLNHLLGQIGTRGSYLVLVLFSLPFISPIPVPGLSNVLGVGVVLLGLHLMAPRGDLRLPTSLGERSFSVEKLRFIIRSSAKSLRWLERWFKPRQTGWFACSAHSFLSGLTIAALGILLALPIPPIVPFSNSLPSWGILLISAATMQKDGVMIWIGYAAALIAIAYFVISTGTIGMLVAGGS